MPDDDTIIAQYLPLVFQHGYDNGALDTAQMAARLNLNLDFRITSTERVHLFLRPFDRVEKGRNTRYEFGGNQRDRFGDTEGLFDLTPKPSSSRATSGRS